MIFFLADRGNYFLDEFFARICQYVFATKIFYDEIDSIEMHDEIVYATPVSDMDYKIMRFIKSHRLVNGLNLQDCFISKPHTDNLLMSYGVAVPSNIVAGNREELKKFIKENKTVVLKQPDKCGGAGHFILKGDKAYSGGKEYDWVTLKKGRNAVRILDNRLLLTPPFYVQKFLPPDNDEIWRAYIVGGEVKFLSTRQRLQMKSLGDYIINVCRGAEYHLFENSQNKKVVDFANRILGRINIDVGTIDILVYENEPYALEVDCDGIHTMICREFYNAPSYDPSKFNFDLMIAQWLKKNI